LIRKRFCIIHYILGHLDVTVEGGLGTTPSVLN
jgi:hypothetical protein